MDLRRCRHCHGEIDRFGTGPWFHVDTMQTCCPTLVAVHAAPITNGK